MKINYLILSTSNFFQKNINKKNFFFIKKKKHFHINKLKKINPKIIFIPKWHWIIPEEILSNYLCIGFHCTPLPYGRGGSPLQNMIVRGFKKTTLCAIKIVKKLDAGPIYKKKKISLSGTGEEILIRMYKQILIMIFDFCQKIPRPKNQIGKIYNFKRRKSHQSDIKNLKKIKTIYDFIRMLDINEKNFPKAYLKNKNFLVTFSNAKLSKNEIIAKAIFKNIN